MKLQQRGFDEFALVLVAALIFIGILAIYWSSTEETPPYILPREVMVYLLPNEKTSLTLKILANASNVYLECPEMLNFVTFSENNFPVDIEKEIKINIIAPSQYNKYSGYIVARTSGGEDRIKLTIFVVPTYQLKYRAVTLPDFDITYYGEEKILTQRDNEFVEKSLFRDKKIKLVFGENRSEIEKAYIEVLIDDVIGPGELIIKQNNDILFDKKVEIEQIIIPLNLSVLRPINFITIESSNPWWNFVGVTKYRIHSIKLVAKFKERGKNFTIQLSRDEIDKFYSLEFSSLTKSYSPDFELEIRVNNQIVYRSRTSPGVFRVNISRDILGEKLVLSEENLLRFSLMSEGEVSFLNNLIKIYSRE
ncbi:MAG: hypothetical protein QXD89_00770 [Candidatus Aenigmatarchaeota archaeon]